MVSQPGTDHAGFCLTVETKIRSLLYQLDTRLKGYLVRCEQKSIAKFEIQIRKEGTQEDVVDLGQEMEAFVANCSKEAGGEHSLRLDVLRCTN